jgi:hypothetical protein
MILGVLLKSDQLIVSLLLLLALTIGYIVGYNVEECELVVEAPIAGGIVVKLPDVELENIVLGINSLGKVKASSRVLFYYADIIRRESNRVGYDWRLVVSIIYVESKFNRLAVSSEGAIGLMQVKFNTARYTANTIGINICRDDLFIPEINIKIGIRYLKMMECKFGNMSTAIQAYWLGPTVVINGSDKMRHVNLIMSNYNMLCEGKI